MTSSPLDDSSDAGLLNQWPLRHDRAYSLQSQLDTQTAVVMGMSSQEGNSGRNSPAANGHPVKSSTGPNSRKRQKSAQAEDTGAVAGGGGGERASNSTRTRESVSPAAVTTGHGAEIASLRSAVTELQRAVTQVQMSSSSSAAAPAAAASLAPGSGGGGGPMRPVTLFPLHSGPGGFSTPPVGVLPPVAPQVLLVTTPRGVSSVGSSMGGGGGGGGVLMDEISSMRQHLTALRQQVEMAKLHKQRRRSKKSSENCCCCPHHHHHHHHHGMCEGGGRGGGSGLAGKHRSRQLPPLTEGLAGGSSSGGSSGGSSSGGFEDVAASTAVPHRAGGHKLGLPPVTGPCKEQIQTLRTVMDTYNQVPPLALDPMRRSGYSGLAPMPLPYASAGLPDDTIAACGGGGGGSTMLLEQVDAMHRSLDAQHQALIRQQEKVLREQEDELMHALNVKERRELEAQQRERDMLEEQNAQEDEMKLLLLLQQQKQNQLLQQQQYQHQMELLQQQAQAAAMAQSMADSVRAETAAQLQAQAQAEAEARAQAEAEAQYAQQVQLLAQLEAERLRALRQQEDERTKKKKKKKNKRRRRRHQRGSSDDDDDDSDLDTSDSDADEHGRTSRKTSRSRSQRSGHGKSYSNNPSGRGGSASNHTNTTTNKNTDPSTAVSPQVRRLQNSLDEMNLKHLAELKKMEDREKQTEEEYKRKLEKLKEDVRAERAKAAEQRQREQEQQEKERIKEKERKQKERQREKEKLQRQKEKEKLKKQKEKEKEKKRKEKEREKAKAKASASPLYHSSPSPPPPPGFGVDPLYPPPYYSQPTPIPSPRDTDGSGYVPPPILNHASPFYPIAAGTVPYHSSPPYDVAGGGGSPSYSPSYSMPNSARELPSASSAPLADHRRASHTHPEQVEYLDADPLLPPQSGRRTPGVGVTDLERKVHRLVEDCRRATQQVEEAGSDASREAHIRAPIAAATRRVEEVGGLLEQLQRDTSTASRELQAANAAAARGVGDESGTGSVGVTFEQLQMLRDQLVDHKRRHEAAVDQGHEVLLATRQQAQREMDKLQQELNSLDREFEHTTEDRDSVADALAKVVAVVNEDNERLKKHEDGPVDKDMEQRHRQHQEQLRDQKDRMKEVDKHLRDIQRQIGEGRTQYAAMVEGFGRDLTRGEEKLHKMADAGERQLRDLADQLRRLNSTQSTTEKKLLENARKKAEKEKQKREKEKQKEKEKHAKHKEKEKQKAKARHARLQALAAMGLPPPRVSQSLSQEPEEGVPNNSTSVSGYAGAPEYDTYPTARGTESGGYLPFEHRYSQLSTVSSGQPIYASRNPSLSPVLAQSSLVPVEKLPSLGKPVRGDSFAHQPPPPTSASQPPNKYAMSNTTTSSNNPTNTGFMVRTNTDNMLFTSVAESSGGGMGSGGSGGGYPTNSNPSGEVLSEPPSYPQSTPLSTLDHQMPSQYRGSGNVFMQPKHAAGGAGGAGIQFVPATDPNNIADPARTTPGDNSPNSILTSTAQTISPMKFAGHSGIGGANASASVGPPVSHGNEEAERQLRDRLQREREQHDDEIRALRQQLSDERHKHDSALQKLRDEELGPAMNKLASANDSETASLLQQLREERARHQEEMDAAHKALEEERARKRDADRKAAQLKSLADNEATAVDSLQDQLRQEQLRHQEEMEALRQELEEAKARALAAEMAAKRAAAAGDGDGRHPSGRDGGDSAGDSHAESSDSAERLRQQLTEERERHEAEMREAQIQMAAAQRLREAQLSELQDQLQERQRELEALRRQNEEVFAREREREARLAAAMDSKEPNENMEALKEKYLNEQDHHHEEIAQLKEKLERSERNAAAAAKRVKDMLAYTGKDPEADARAKELEYQLKEADRKTQLALLRQRETHREEMQAMLDEKEKQVKDMQVLLEAQRRKEAFEAKQRDEERKRMQLAVDAREDDLHKMEKRIKEQEKALRSPRASRGGSVSQPSSLSPTRRSLNASPSRPKKLRNSMGSVSGSVGNSFRQSGNHGDRPMGLPDLDTVNLTDGNSDPLHSHRSLPPSSRVPAKIFTMVQGGEWLKEKYKEEPVYAKRDESEVSELGSMDLLTPARIRKGKVAPVSDQPLFSHRRSSVSGVQGQLYGVEQATGAAGEVVAHEE